MFPSPFSCKPLNEPVYQFDIPGFHFRNGPHYSGFKPFRTLHFKFPLVFAGMQWYNRRSGWFRLCFVWSTLCFGRRGGWLFFMHGLFQIYHSG